MQRALAGRAAIARRVAVAGEALAGERLVHHAVDRLAAARQRDQRAPGRHAGDEGLGAVDRIEHPDIFGVGALVAELLADDAVIGKALPDQRAHGGFGGAVGGGHRIEAAAAALVLDAERGAEERQDGFAGDGRQPVDESLQNRWQSCAVQVCAVRVSNRPSGMHQVGASSACADDDSRITSRAIGVQTRSGREGRGMTTESGAAPPRAVNPLSAIAHRGRGDARRALHRQPVPAQFGRRDRARSRRRDRAVADRDRAALQHLFLRLRGDAVAARRGARPLRPEALHAGVDRLHRAGLRAVRAGARAPAA